jgi:hypothetical protein
MFGFGKQTKITAIFAQLNQFRNSLGLNKAESVISRADIESILELSNDVRTTVELVLLFWESRLAERMAASEANLQRFKPPGLGEPRHGAYIES